MCLTPSLKENYYSILRNSYYYSTPPDLSEVFFVVRADTLDKNMVIDRLLREFNLKIQRKRDFYTSYSPESVNFRVEFISETFYKIVIDMRKFCFTLDFIFPIRDCQVSSRTEVKLNSFQAQRNMLKHIRDNKHNLKIRRDSHTRAVTLENMKVFTIMTHFNCEYHLRNFDIELIVSEIDANRDFHDHIQNQISRIDQLPTATNVSWPSKCNTNPPSTG